jgi:DNA-directed RNA polymerase specialized sigma24 family protein
VRSRSEAKREAAYVEFVTARRDHLRRIAYLMCGDWAQADEILGRALTRLYVAWPRLERDGTEDAYVQRLVVRAEARPTDSSHPRREPVVVALMSLPPSQRRVVVLRHGLGLSDGEIAEVLGISVGSVRTEARRAQGSLPADMAQEVR